MLNSGECCERVELPANRAASSDSRVRTKARHTNLVSPLLLMSAVACSSYDSSDPIGVAATSQGQKLQATEMRYAGAVTGVERTRRPDGVVLSEVKFDPSVPVSKIEEALNNPDAAAHRYYTVAGSYFEDGVFHDYKYVLRPSTDQITAEELAEEAAADARYSHHPATPVPVIAPSLAARLSSATEQEMTERVMVIVDLKPEPATRLQRGRCPRLPFPTGKWSII
jgi:hypothetical protein